LQFAVAAAATAGESIASTSADVPNRVETAAVWRQVARSARCPIVQRFVVISGCSGGGKSTLLRELAQRGHAVVEEPGRRIVRDELERGGTALPWVDGVAFARRAIELALANRADAHRHAGWVFFDRGLVDAAVALQHLTGEPVLTELGQRHRYHRRVFLAPPWREIYATDPERRHGFDDAIAEYGRLSEAYGSLGYEVMTLPKLDVALRADFVIGALSAAPFR
jgi:predicted ATPase